MTTRRRHATWLSVAALGALATAPAAQQREFRGTMDLVSVYATVMDRDGRLVTDLTAEDFEIKDNGKRQPLTFFSSEALPFSAVVMLDRSGSMSSNFSVVTNAVSAFVSAMNTDDRARVGSFSSEIRLAPEEFTSDRTELVRVLQSDLQEIGPSPVWTAVDRSLTALLPMPDRRVVLLFSDGHDAPRYGQLRTRLEDLVRRVRVNGIMVYAIGFPSEVSRSSGRGVVPRPRGPIRFPIPIPGYPPGAPVSPIGLGGTSLGKRYQPPDPGLKDLAEVSGGGYFEWEEGTNLTETFVRVAQELHQQYWLGFVPAKLDGKTHDIEVRVRRRGMTVRARQHYVATPSGRQRP